MEIQMVREKRRERERNTKEREGRKNEEGE